MKKYIFITIITCCISNVLFTQQLRLTREILLDNSWGPDGGGYGFYISFNDRDTYTMFFLGGGRPSINGNYEIFDDMLYIYPQKGNPGIFSDLFNTEMIFTYQIDANAFINENMLVSNDFSFHNQNSGISETNREINFQGTDIIKLGFTQLGIIIHDIYLYSEPSHSSDYYLFQESFSTEYTPFLIPDHEIVILARTTNSFDYNGETGPFYFCDLKLGWYDYMILNNDPEETTYINQRVWIFAPDIEVMQ